MTLHEAIVKLLQLSARSMTTTEIANELNKNGWYQKKDGSLISNFQIHGRTKNYPHLFVRNGTTVSLLAEVKVKPYTYDEHVHNFATWTAARATSRAFTSTLNIKYAIEKSSLRDFSESNNFVDLSTFESFHRICSSELISAFNRKNVKATYGRAAKIIAVYLKTTVIIPNRAVCDKSAIIHPPIDSILLTRLSDKTPGLDLRNVKWTKLDEAAYWSLVSQIREKISYFDWRLEEFWSPEIE